MAEVERRAFLRPEADVLLIGADQEALTLLPEVVFAVAVGDGGEAAALRGDLRDGFGDEILVLRRDQRQVKPGHRGDLPAPEARGVDDPVAVDVSLGRLYDPCAVGLLDRGGDGGVAVDFGAERAGAGGIGHGDAGRIDVAAVLLIHDAADAVVVDEGVKLLRLLAADLAEIHAVMARLGGLNAELVLSRLRLREVERTRLEDAAALTRLFLQLLVEVHRIVLDAGDVGVVVEAVNARRRVPGGA